jgi:nitroreductase
VDAYTAIVTKQDSRAFDPRPVPEETVRRILQAGRMAGSSKNSQPCRFVVLQDAERRQKIAACGDFAKHVPEAPLCIAVVLTSGGGAFDAGRAAQNMMVAAWAEGVTSCPTSMHNPTCAGQTLGLPPEHTVAIVLAMGYPAESAGRASRKRAPLEELVHWERW